MAASLPLLRERMRNWFSTITSVSVAASHTAPWYGRRTGKGAVREYFASIGETIEVLDFKQLSFTANDTEVMVLNQFRMRSRKTGKEATMHLHHYWRFRDGKVAYRRGSEDTEQTATMLKPSTRPRS